MLKYIKDCQDNPKKLNKEDDELDQANNLYYSYIITRKTLKMSNINCVKINNVMNEMPKVVIREHNSAEINQENEKFNVIKQ
ncbi:Hypothetical protein SRAE_2000329500 [Strongyloides ratti]|uniref:Uncharacterized protein n=1 Tax=Strongyloides ratti TaxID=34506 RepID=A0A090LM63_STRRB|nr:Hypothetical protein SRAE_2000329500 [Strongyloides ratti]CEF68640.1 Hypothetical protein SRAE_2000329500 [Strongyloides ratti]